MTTCKWPSDDDDEWNLRHRTPSSKKARLSPGALHIADVSDCFCVKAEISGRRTSSACCADLTVVKSVTSCWRMVRQQAPWTWHQHCHDAYQTYVRKKN